MMVIFLLCFYSFSRFVTAATDCDNSYECSGSTISDTDVVCTGEYGCYNADITTTSGYVSCYGYYGCYTATLNVKTSLYCHGYYGCRDTDIQSAATIYSDGDRGLYNARIDTADQTTLTVKVYGYYGGYNADIICRSGVTCKLYCAYNGCYNLDFVCLSGATCTVSPSGCTTSNGGSAYGTTICPSWASSSSSAEDDALLSKLEEKRLRIKEKEAEEGNNDDDEALNDMVLFSEKRHGMPSISTEPISGMGSTTIICWILSLLVVVALLWLSCYCYKSVTNSHDGYKSLIKSHDHDGYQSLNTI